MPSLKEKLAKTTSKLARPREKIEDHPANLTSYQDGAFYNIDIDLITPDPNQPRKFFDEDSLNELALSIKQKGVLQPVIIRKDDDGKIFLVAGERRFRAAKMAGLERMPSIITKGNPMEIAIIENLQRDDLKPIEEAEALGRMVEEYNYTQEQLSLVIGKSQSTLSETLSLNRLPSVVKDQAMKNKEYPRRLLIEVAKQKTEEEMISLFDRIKENNLKSGQVRDITRKQARNKQRTPAAIILEKASILDNSLTKLDLASIEESEKLKLIACLERLKTAIGQIIS